MSTIGNYYSGGLAEIVSSPSQLTYSFLAKWFTGKGSLGMAMESLGMPYQKIDLPVLDLKDGELVVNLENEERTLYQKTIFKYKKQNNINIPPKLVIDFTKIIRLTCLLNTIRIIFVQSKWITSSRDVIKTAEKFVSSIPNKNKSETADEVSELLKNKVWPNVIAIGLMSEFYSQLLESETKNNFTEINNYISSLLAKSDWFFQSIADQAKVKQGKLSFSAYIDKYGLRADKDYDLTSPRWYEIKDVIKKRISDFTNNKTKRVVILNLNKKTKALVDVSIALQLLRSESKRKALVHINELRTFTKKIKFKNEPKSMEIKDILIVSSGKGAGISQGQVEGIVRNVNDNFMIIPPKTIGIFPRASPEFTSQYPKCVGLIFLRGGQTSHGAIVAREFGIPAIIDSKAEGIKDTSQVELNGLTGEWHIC